MNVDSGSKDGMPEPFGEDGWVDDDDADLAAWLWASQEHEQAQASKSTDNLGMQDGAGGKSSWSSKHPKSMIVTYGDPTGTQVDQGDGEMRDPNEGSAGPGIAASMSASQKKPSTSVSQKKPSASAGGKESAPAPKTSAHENEHGYFETDEE